MVPMFQTAAGRFPHLASQRRSSLDHCESPPSAFRQVCTPCEMDTNLLCRDIFIDGMRSSSTLAKVDPSLQNSVSQD